jgi:hypothetical protein
MGIPLNRFGFVCGREPPRRRRSVRARGRGEVETDASAIAARAERGCAVGNLGGLR